MLLEGDSDRLSQVKPNERFRNDGVFFLSWMKETALIGDMLISALML
jgi:hypothetical protein